MILKSLHLRNYKQYRFLDLEFREGLVGIIGRNGAGKSTLLEAVLYCLFGKDENNKNLIRTASADPKETVQLTLNFTIGEALYSLRREFRGRQLTTYADLLKNDHQVATGVSPVNNEIARLLNMERDAFKRSVFSGQKELSELSDTSGEARKRMVRKMIGLDQLDQIQSQVNTDIKDFQNRVIGQQHNLLDLDAAEQLQEQLEQGTEALTDRKADLELEQQALEAENSAFSIARNRFEDAEKLRKGHIAAREKLENLLGRHQSLEKQRTDRQTKLAELEQRREKLRDQNGQLEKWENERAELHLLDDAYKAKLERETTVSQVNIIEETLTDEELKLTELNTAFSQKQNLLAERHIREQELASLQEQATQWQEEARQLEQELGDLRGRIQERRERVEKIRALGAESACPTCGQPLRDVYEDTIQMLSEEIEILQVRQLADATTRQQNVAAILQRLDVQQRALSDRRDQSLQALARLDQLDRQRQTCEQNLRLLQQRRAEALERLAALAAPDFDEHRFRQLQETVGASEDHYRHWKNEQSYLAAELPLARHAVEQAQTLLDHLRQDLDTTQLLLDNLAFDADAYETIRLDFTNRSEQLNIQSQRVHDFRLRVVELENQLTRTRERLQQNTRIQEQIREKQAEITRLKRLSDLLGMFKTEILEKVSPSISREASFLFSRITKGKYENIRVDDNFDFSIADSGLYYPIERFSGGEIDLANFCLRIAITKAIVELSGGQSVEFLAFDEIFGSQDEDRRYEMMLALHYLQEQFRQIYIVSHIDSIKEFFPNILEVRSGPEGSRAEWL